MFVMDLLPADVTLWFKHPEIVNRLVDWSLQRHLVYFVSVMDPLPADVTLWLKHPEIMDQLVDWSSQRHLGVLCVSYRPVPHQYYSLG